MFSATALLEGGFPSPAARNPGRRLRGSDHVVRAAAAHLLAIACDFRNGPAQFAEELWPADVVTRDLIRSATSPATLSDPGWAGSLAGEAVADFVSTLPSGAFAALRSRGIELDIPHAAVLHVPSVGDVEPATFIGAGAPIPVRQFLLDGPTLTPKKVATIVIYSIDVARLPRNVEAIMRALLSESAILGLDARLLSDATGTEIAPAGLFHGIDPLPPSNSDDPTIAFREDLRALAAALGARASDDLVLVLNKAQAMMARAAVPNGLQVASSPAMPAGRVALIDGGAFASMAGPGIEFDQASQAAVHSADPASPIVDSLGVPGTPVRSLWQEGLIGMRAIWSADWGMRGPDLVRWMEGVKW